MSIGDIETVPLVVPGIFDISKWYRNTDLAFWVKENDKIIFKENFPLFYIKFHTEEKIIFKQYRESDFLKNIRFGCLNSTKNSKKNKKMNDFYSLFSGNKKIIKEIKENVLD